jgi:hypothetical protein
MSLSGLRICAEANAYIVHLLSQSGRADGFSGEQMMLQAVERHGAIHSSAIYIQVSDRLRQPSGHRTLSARRESVDGYNNPVHVVNIFVSY